MISVMKRIFALLTITFFFGAGSAPLVHSMGMGDEGSVHYCKHSGGPCKHASRKTHKKGEESDNSRGTHGGHAKGGSCKTFIGCTKTGGTPQLLTALEMPFITAEASFYTPGRFETLPEKSRFLYRDPFPDLFDRPPAPF
jgi:hypothetical protein